MQKCKVDYTDKEIDEIMELLPTYTEKQKKEIAFLLIDLAHIYNNANLD